MNDKQRNRAFAKARVVQMLNEIRIQKETALQIGALLAEASQRVQTQMSVLPSDFQRWFLPQIQAEINATLHEFNQMAGSALGAGADASWAGGIAMIDAPVAAGGILIESALPHIDRAQLLAIKQFMTSRISDISTKIAMEINTELGMVLIGVQSPGDAVGSIAGKIEGGRGRAITIVRTELGRVFSIATQARLTQASEFLPGMEKQWRRSGKIHSRTEHDAVDGQVRAHDKQFDVGGEKLRFPRDPRGSAKNTINCGCVLLPFMKHWKVKNPGRLQFTDEELRISAQKAEMQAKIDGGGVA